MIPSIKCLKEVKIRDINLDRKPFSFSFPEFDRELFESISSIGLTNPPIILPVSAPACAEYAARSRTGRQKKITDRFYVVSGLRRILACKKLGMKIIPCFIIKAWQGHNRMGYRPDAQQKLSQKSKDSQVNNTAWQVAATGWSYRSSEKKLCQKNTMSQDCNTDMELDYERIILLNLQINLSHRKLNDIEKANLLKLLGEEGISHEKIINKYMPYLKLEKSRKIYEDILSLNSLNIRNKMKVIEWDLPLKTSAALAGYSKSDRASVMKIAEKLMPGINRLKEIMLFLEEIALIQKCSIADITGKYLENIVENSKIDRKERTEKVRQRLKELRYPQLIKMERKWNECVRELHLPPNIKVIPPLSFEGKKIKLEISLTTKDSIAPSLTKLNETLKSDSLTELIDLVNAK